MPSHNSYASALQQFNVAIDDVSARVQQDRALHMGDLTNTYMQAIVERMPSAYLTMLETSIGQRNVYNTRKLVFDATDLSVQDAKLSRALGANSGTLSGGGVGDMSRDALKAMHYSAKRSNALHTSFNQKLAHDRTVHAHELAALYNQTPANTNTGRTLASMMSMRATNNLARTSHDAASWADTDMSIGATLGGGGNAREVLSHGVQQTLSDQAAPRRFRGGGGGGRGGNYRFDSPEAAALWDHVMQS